MAKRERQRLLDFGRDTRRPRLCRLEGLLSAELIASGFSQVSTPIIMSRGHLAKMSITADHPLADLVLHLTLLPSGRRRARGGLEEVVRAELPEAVVEVTLLAREHFVHHRLQVAIPPECLLQVL